MSASVPTRPRRRRRLAVLGTVGLLLISAVLFVQRYWLTHPVGTGPAGPLVDSSPFQQPWTQQRVLLVGIGDSITDGLGSSPSSNSYFNRLIKNPPDEFEDLRGISLSKVIPNLETVNLARSGTNSIEHLEILLPDLEVQPPDVYGIVVMTTGGNDIIHYYGRRPPKEGAMYGATRDQAQPWIANFRTRLEKIIAAIESKLPGGCSIFLANIYDPTDGVGSALTFGLPRWRDGLEILRSYNEILANCAQIRPNVHLVDIHQLFLGHGIYSQQFWKAHYDSDDPHYWYWGNFEDPNNRGYDAIRRLFLIEMSTVLPRRLLRRKNDARPDKRFDELEQEAASGFTGNAAAVQ